MKGRGLVALVTAGLLAGSAMCGFIWWTAVKSKLHEPTYDHSEPQPPVQPEAEPSEPSDH